MLKKVLFRFEASPHIGAGHAIRSCVIADALKEQGWQCQIITSARTYDFIKNLARFKRIEPEEFFLKPLFCDLLVVDNYDLDKKYEQHFRHFAKKILVIDDLANRKHTCDILLDQTYGRDAIDYKKLVPKYCKILAGSEYVLLRKKFIQLRPKALKKRSKTTNIKRILISLGGSDPKNYTLKTLQIIKKSKFKGIIDIVLGFSAPNLESIKKYLQHLPNKCIIYTNADMPKLIYNADLAIGAAGTSVWERSCLGLATLTTMIANNQKNNFASIKHFNHHQSLTDLLQDKKIYDNPFGADIVDGFGINRVTSAITNEEILSPITLRKVTGSDKKMIYKWQNIKGVRQFFNNPKPPSWREHTAWFRQRLKNHASPYWVICENHTDIGMVSLDYNHAKELYDLSWLIIPEKWGGGLGTQALKLVRDIVKPFKIHAFVKPKNLASHKVFKNLGFKKLANQNYISA